jgi:tetratricopeptide (TPR) repeat protein
MHRVVAIVGSAAVAMLLGGCQSYTGVVRPTPDGPPLYRGLGSHHHKVTTDSDLAQKYFDQGLIWAFAFNHDEAIRSFDEAARQDPKCAMAWWGVALCNGPHINNTVVSPERAKAAWDALQKARALASGASPKERDLIEALAQRYADPQPVDRTPLDRAYAAAMRKVWQKYGDDNDVGVLFAESLMDLRPWDLYDYDGTPRPETPEVLLTLETVRGRDADHPGANHLYIHAVEASSQPERAIDAADRLRRAVPIAGHLVHMPGHIDVRTGQWAKAAEANIRAIAADDAYRGISPRQSFYRVYMLHNHHFLTFASMMEGREEASLEAARDMLASVPADYARENAAMVDPYMMTRLDVLKRFGRWNEILAEPQPPSYWPITTAMWRCDRALAQAALGRVSEARAEQSAFRAAAAQVPADAMYGVNKAHAILAIADKLIEGEIAYREGRADAAIAALQEGVQLEDRLRYMEPPEWIQPMRHTLGAVLLASGRAGEAERVYRDDLVRWPGNGWSLYGLSVALKKEGRESDAKDAQRRFDKAWARADYKIDSSCACVSARMASDVE